MSNHKTVKANKLLGFVNQLRSTQLELRKSIWRYWHNPKGQTLPIFLVGSGRSGTNMLVYYLSRLWHIELYNEDNPAAFKDWRLRELKNVRMLIDRSQAHIALFKPILDTYRVHVLLSRFPESKVLFAFRHYNDVINSSLKKFGVTNRINHVKAWMNEDFGEFAIAPPPKTIKDFIRSLWKPSLSPESGAALFWLFHNQLFYDLNLGQNERVKLVRYESVVSEPIEEFKKICHFINVPFEPYITKGVHSSSIKRDSSPEIDPEIQVACESLWQSLCQREGSN